MVCLTTHSAPEGWVTFFLTTASQFEARLPAKKFRKYVCLGRNGGGANAASEDEKDTAEVMHEEVSRA
jgi:hypothetical protein